MSAASWVVRYRILNMYSRLPPEPQRKEPEIDLFPDTHEQGSKPGLSNYLDEFLSAIKIFGYLERPVFHELTRSMQTRKLIAGETINLEEEKGFCIVVDGLVEIFVKSGLDPRAAASSARGRLDFDSSDEDDSPPGQQRYQLLTEVRNGAPMSSLFSIMSLFTEDVKLRASEDDSPLHSGAGNGGHAGFRKQTTVRVSSENPTSIPRMPHMEDEAENSDLQSPNRPASAQFGNDGGSSRVPPMSLDDSAPRAPTRPGLPSRATSGSAHPDIIARATRDTTIAIIPASAFRRLIKIYPKATSHIVHVILSRFQRVSLSQAFNYLGLTSEVLHTEKSMIKFTMCQLPNILRGDALTRLKEKFSRERERLGDAEETKGIALHNSAATRRRRSSTRLRKEAMLQSMSKQRTTSVVTSTIAPPKERASAHTPSPGDLLANIQLARGVGKLSAEARPQTPDISIRGNPMSPLDHRHFNPFDSQKQARIHIDPRESVDEDNLFRASIMECMFKSLGLDSGGSASREPDSMEGSPQLASFDQRRPKPFYSNNAFGFMGPFDGSVDGETESVASSGLPMYSPPNAQLLAHDMRDDLEIVFFPKGSVLVEQGERNPGLYYVVDGFLDIGTTSEEDPHNILKTSGVDGLSPEPVSPEPSEMGSFPNLARTEAARDRAESQRQAGQIRRRSVALVKPGGLAGYIGSVSSYRSFIDVVAKTDVYVGFLPRVSLERIVDRYPIVLLTMAKRLTHILPPLILHIDFALEWISVNAGEILFHKGDESEAIYIVLNGRLRLVEDRKNGGVSSLAEYGQGDSIGELEVLTETARPGTLHAIRDTEVVKFPRTLFNSLAQEHPNITIKISKIIASRMRAVVDDPSRIPGNETSLISGGSKRKSTMNLRTVAVLPITAGVPVVEFGNRLMNALTQVGPPNGATSLNQAAILNHLGKHAFNKMGKLRLSQYLADLEEKYGLVVYVAGKRPKIPLISSFSRALMMRKTPYQRQRRCWFT